MRNISRVPNYFCFMASVMSLNIIQQHLFSYFNLTKVSSLKSTLKAFEEIINETKTNVPCTEDQLCQEISNINAATVKYDLEIAESVDEITCERVFVLINTADCIVTKKFKFYEDSTSQFFAKIVKDCMLAEEGCVSETHCLNLNMQVKLSKVSSQLVLDKLIKHKWLVSTNDKISLGMRSIVELEQNIKQYYPDNIKNCPFCKLMVIQGFRCTNCQKKCHFACLKKYCTLSKSDKFCPSCKTIWDDIPPLMREVRELTKEDAISDVTPRKKRKKL